MDSSIHSFSTINALYRSFRFKIRPGAPKIVGVSHRSNGEKTIYKTINSLGPNFVIGNYNHDRNFSSDFEAIAKFIIKELDASCLLSKKVVQCKSL
ncbi:hypothetical protein LEP1GSC161_1091 [Leptospira santarosai str. CBC1416]|uniref:Uncharacterized protein n=1 Tax=Leptospira santarosai str. CBC1416 TaxID=1193059 RepID=M6W574_9LEPT|nr:hypothetical protein LEP1GSC161_1091 [Leptospira santarosai str. CBC1416]